MVITDEQAGRAWDSSEHLHMLLNSKDPDFFATLRAAERLLDREMSGESGCAGRSNDRSDECNICNNFLELPLTYF